MSILNSLINELAKDNNIVMVVPNKDDTGRKNFINEQQVYAVALTLLNGVAYQLLFLKGSPLAYLVNPTAEHTRDIRRPLKEVVAFNSPLSPLGYLDRKEITSLDSLFHQLMEMSFRDSGFSLIEFSPVKETFRWLGAPETLDVFKGVNAFVDDVGAVRFGQTIMHVSPTRKREESRRPAPQMEWGNVLVQMTDGRIYWVAPPKEHSFGKCLHSFSHASTYNDLIQFKHHFEADGWYEITGMAAIEKPPTPKEETKEKYEEQKAKDEEAARKGREHVINGLEKAINEYFVILDGVGAKKRGEIRDGIIAQFIKEITDDNNKRPNLF